MGRRSARGRAPLSGLPDPHRRSRRVGSRADGFFREKALTVDVLRAEGPSCDVDVGVDEVDGVLELARINPTEAVLFGVRHHRQAAHYRKLLHDDGWIERLDHLYLQLGRLLRV